MSHVVTDAYFAREYLFAPRLLLDFSGVAAKDEGPVPHLAILKGAFPSSITLKEVSTAAPMLHIRVLIVMRLLCGGNVLRTVHYLVVAGGWHVLQSHRVGCGSAGDLQSRTSEAAAPIH